jgi:ubiquinone/menaquinone biosynthesis C-methylase UbiE
MTGDDHVVRESDELSADLTADLTADFRTDIRAAYDATGPAWDRGPGRIYELLAAALLDSCPATLRGAIAVDAGAGTGAASMELVRRGARVVAVDLSVGMLRCIVGAADRDLASSVVAAVGDLTRLPLRSQAADVSVAAFVLNHVADPVAALAELARVTRSDGAVLASVFGADVPHPSKQAIDAVAARHGFVAPVWHQRLKDTLEKRLNDRESLASSARQAGLGDVSTEVVVLDPGVSESELVSWRTGMAHLAPFIATLPLEQRKQLLAEAHVAVRAMPPLELTMLIVAGRAGNP